jgi:hypothetical protein
LDFGFNVNDPTINRISVQIGQSFWKEYYLQYFS